MLGGVVTLDGLVRATSALLAAVTLTGTLAGIRRQRGNAVVASLLLAVVLVFCGALLAIPAVIGAAAVLAQLRRRRPSHNRYRHLFTGKWGVPAGRTERTPSADLTRTNPGSKR